MTCFKHQFEKSKPKGSSIKLNFKEVFMNMKNNANSTHAWVPRNTNATKQDQMQSLTSKHSEFIDLDQKYEHACNNIPENNSKFQDMHMHA